MDNASFYLMYSLVVIALLLISAVLGWLMGEYHKLQARKLAQLLRRCRDVANHSVIYVARPGGTEALCRTCPITPPAELHYA